MIKVFGAAPARSLRVLWMLEEMGLPYEREPVDFANRHANVEFMACSPAGMLPAIADGETRLFESCAILEYLAAKHGPTDLAPGPDSPSYPLYIQYLHFGEGSLAGPLNIVVGSRFFAPPEARKNWGADFAVDMVAGRAAVVAQQLEKTPYVAGEAFTAADISVGYALGLGRMLGFADRLAPGIISYLDRLTQRPAYQRALAPA
jgi:glutathione S-transferase